MTIETIHLKRQVQIVKAPTAKKKGANSAAFAVT
jgi:hypothetical protein